MPMISVDYAKEFTKDQRALRNNTLRSQTLTASFALKISLATDGKKFATPWLCVSSDLKSNLPILHVSSLLAPASVIPDI